MTDETVLNTGQWIDVHAKYGFSLDGDRIALSRRSDVVIEADAPDDTPIELTPLGGPIAISLDNNRLHTVYAKVGEIRFGGPGIVETFKPTSSTDSVLLNVGADVRIGFVDASVCPRLALVMEPGAAIEQLVTGEGTIEARHTIPPGRTDGIHQLCATSTALKLDGDQELATRAFATAHGQPVTIERGHLMVAGEVAESQRLTIAAGATLRLLGSYRGGVISLNGSRFILEGPGAVGENLLVNGVDGRVGILYGGQLVAPRFETRSLTELRVERGEVSLVRGHAVIQLGPGATITGAGAEGLAFHDLVVDVTAEAVESLNFFEIARDQSVLPELDKVSRVSAWWPSRRRDVISRARSVDCGVVSEASHRPARARYWLRVERLMKDKAPTGRDVAVAHELAEDSRRLAASKKHLERWLLELSRLAGYGARMGQPILLWLLGALIFALLIRHMAGGICWSCSIDSGVSLWWDLLISPVNFIRPVDEASTLTRLVRGDTPARMLSFAARAFGTWMLVSLALAARRYLRTT